MVYPLGLPAEIMRSRSFIADLLSDGTGIGAVAHLYASGRAFKANTVANKANTLKGVVRQCSPNTAEQCSPMFAVRLKCSPMKQVAKGFARGEIAQGLSQSGLGLSSAAPEVKVGTAAPAVRLAAR